VIDGGCPHKRNSSDSVGHDPARTSMTPVGSGRAPAALRARSLRHNLLISRQVYIICIIERWTRFGMFWPLICGHTRWSATRKESLGSFGP
jgi:hypothetical protein